MKKFCESLREQVIKIMYSEKKKIIPVINKQQELYEKTKICYIFTKSLYISTKLGTIVIILVNAGYKCWIEHKKFKI